MKNDNEAYPRGVYEDSDVEDYPNGPPVDWYKILLHIFLWGLVIATLWVCATGCKSSKHNKPKYSYGQSKTEVSRAVGSQANAKG
jgi:hypothetical protein